MSSDKHFDANKVFYWLFGLTALEVGWAEVGHPLNWPRWLLWGGLVFWALCKAFLIASYFMHLRFEGWIVKGLIVPTPFLVLVILAVLSPDIAFNRRVDHAIGSQYDPVTGKVIELKRAAHEHEGEHAPVEPAPVKAPE
jgi:caa(3)-type oxidase subunit IV